ncbi:ABC transporter ATP-binding protein [Vibrio sp. S9_S30]|uniref:ABC transporter ATP-binding protein n=1 Tax=Vibrio sp. S9_S30 TaxID=2720226 RepID=UPI0016811C03|nr:ABC transporter ATP-binding protein [Vibrio sp. S9_S30]MBD1558187.1 ABC transporter ATP-binding protein [Vibrio sp. S9_S30]
MSGIQLKQLIKKYDGKTAVKGIDLDIPDGTFCVFLGPSGCGKSTTLNCIAGLELPSGGTIQIQGQDVTQLPPHQRDIAMVFQSSLLYPHLTARDNIKMSLRNIDITEKTMEERIVHAVDILEIGKLLDKKPAQLSGGERQRVAMAKAIVRSPAVFLMDEPLAALDASLRQVLRSELVHLQKKLNVTTIFVTHDQVEAMTMGDLVVVMNEGNIEQVGTPTEIYNHPASRFVAQFIGSPPMNFFQGQLREEGGKRYFHGNQLKIDVTNDTKFDHLSDQSNCELGIRGHHLCVTDDPDAIKGEVYGVENLGREKILIAKAPDGTSINIVTNTSNNHQIGDPISIGFSLNDAYVF